MGQKGEFNNLFLALGRTLLTSQLYSVEKCITRTCVDTLRLLGNMVETPWLLT